MSGVVRVFGYLSIVAGPIVAGLVLSEWMLSGAAIPAAVWLAAAAWVVGGLFWGALCVTVANTHDGIAVLRTEFAATRVPPAG